MSSVDYEGKILDAIDTMVTNAVSKAGYDKTIKAVIASLEDAATGKYKIKYQDSEIEAYSNNVDVRYPAGTLVYILVPGNDFSQTKTILDAVDKSKLEHVTVLEEDEQYTAEGGNSISATQSFGLCSYHKDEVKYLYSRDNNINDINYDALTFEESIKEHNEILCGAKFKTNFDSAQKRLGDFGVVYEIDFKDNITGAILTKVFKIDVNKMSGTPYDLNNFTRQYGVFLINNENFISVKNIYIYCKDFPTIDEDKTINDIFVSDFELYGIRELTYEEINGYSLNLIKNGRGYFNDFSSLTDTVTISATLKSKNRVVTAEDVEYYWFKENNDITIDSDKYLNYGGEGWECVNRYNEIDGGNNMYLTSDKEYSITREECGNAITRVKCVAVRDNTAIVESSISIFNYEPNHSITITSNQGTQFYFDNGNPDLICKIDGLEDTENYTYTWSSVDVNGEFNELAETTEDNEIYNTAIADYALLEAQVATETVMPEAAKSELERLKAIIDSFEYKQRVEKNRIYKVDLTQVVGETTFKCMVKKNGNIIGTAEITLHNNLGLEGDFKLNIINGTQVFSYDNNGVAPTSKSIEKPIKLKPLSFEVIDNFGNKFSDLIISTCDILWEVPQTDTLLIGENSTETSLTYDIAENYDNRKLFNNNIKLTVKYKNLILSRSTEFTFTKDGDPGTNGTGVVCKIVPNTEDEIFGYPMLTNGVPNFTPAATGKWFKVQLWENGNKTFEGVDSDSAHTITWSILRNTYTRSNGQNVQDNAAIAVNGSTFSYNGYVTDSAAIIKVELVYQGVTYYCTLPLIIADITDTNYTVQLVENTGFRYVMYSSDGKRPQYDNVRPFEIKVTQLINGYVEDVTNVNNQYKVSYDWAIKGKIFSVTANDFINDLHLSFVNNSNLAGNQKFLVPNEDYDGENVTNAVEVKILTSDLAEKGKILIPIHFYLDRYGHAELNGWDGNRIAINNDSGSILAPQVGAGKKENDNTFSGVLMGTVKERGNDRHEQGLFGYYHGQRSIFLDSDTGKAEFGFNGTGQVIIDPTQGKKAMIYGGNYKNNHSTGMYIDLTTPEIGFGSGHFKVTNDGNLTAVGGGSIGGWRIGNDSISAGNIYLNANGSMSGGSSGHTWSITTEGKATFNDATVKGTIEASNGSIGGWQIDASRIYSSNGLSYMNSDGSAKFGNFSIANNGSITASGGTFNDITANRISVSGGSITIGSSFSVNSSGSLTTTSGRIGNWYIKNNGLYYNNGNSIYLNGNGIVRFQTSGGGVFSMGQDTNNPYVSALNIDGALVWHQASGSYIQHGSATPGSTVRNHTITVQGGNAVWLKLNGAGSKTGFAVTPQAVTTFYPFYFNDKIYVDGQDGETTNFTVGSHKFYFTHGILTKVE